MRILHIRNATIAIELDDQLILVDPMIGPVGTLPPFSFIRSKPKKNPTVPFPENCKDMLSQVTQCLITHRHPDHLDKEAIKFLADQQTPVTCSDLDVKSLSKQGLNIVQSLKYGERTSYLDGIIEGIQAQHGYGFTATLGGNVMGFYIDLPNQPTVYLSSDTIYTQDVQQVLADYKPDISVLAAGTAQFDLFKPLLMTLDDCIRFVRDAPGTVIANHMDAVNHCRTTRRLLRQALTEHGLLDKTLIPTDGQWLDFN